MIHRYARAGLAGAIALALSACATHAPLLEAGQHDHEPNLVAMLAKRKKPYNKPAEAARYFSEMRAPQGETTLDYRLWREAEQDASRLSWMDSATLAVRAPASRSAIGQLSTWEQLGPGNIGGRTRVILFEPGRASTMYIAGVAGGLWKSTNAGDTWVPLNDLAPNIAVNSGVIDGSNPSRLWIGTGEGYFNGDAVRGAGIFVSTNGGLDFTQLPSTAPSATNINFLFVNDLAQSPTNPDGLYASTNTGLWRSTDAGVTWTQVINANATNVGGSPATHFGGCFDVSVRPGTTATDDVLVGCGSFAIFESDIGAVYRNTDALGAGAWTPTLFSTTQARTTLAHAPSDPQTVYALAASNAADATADGLLAVYRSQDGGTTWEERTVNSGSNANNNLLLTNPVIARLQECGFGPPGSNALFNQGWYDNVIAVDPTNPDRVWTGGIDLFRSDDGGQNWGNASYWWFPPSDPNYAHADHHAIAFHPEYDGVSNRMLYIAHDGGIQRTDDATAAVGTNTSDTPANSICGQANLPEVTWSSLNNGYSVTQFFHGTVYPDSSAFLGGTQDNGTLRRRPPLSSNQWEELLGGDGAYVAVSPEDTDVVYAANTDISIQKSTNGGGSFAAATSGINDSGLFINPFAMDPNAPDTLWTSGRQLWRTTNGAANWAAASAPLSAIAPFNAGHRHSIQAIAPGDSDFVVVGTNQGQLLRNTAAGSADGTTVWNGVRPRSGFVGDIAFNAAESDLPPDERTVIAVYATFNPLSNPTSAAHVWRSIDGGQTWVGIDGTGSSRIPNVPVHTVVIDPTWPNGQRVFVGTDVGVFVTIDGGETWLRENTGAANTVVEELVLQRNPASGDLELTAFTHGRSVYRTRVAAFVDGVFSDGFESAVR
jgi:hypothetical protein